MKIEVKSLTIKGKEAIKKERLKYLRFMRLENDMLNIIKAKLTFHEDSFYLEFTEYLPSNDKIEQFKQDIKKSLFKHNKSVYDIDYEVYENE